MYKAEYIFMRLLLPFAAGIFIAWFLKIYFPDWSVLLTAFLFLLTEKIIYKRAVWLFRYKWVSGIFIYIALIVTGSKLTQTFYDVNRQNHFSNYLNDAEYALLQIQEPPEDKGQNRRMVVSVFGIERNNVIHSCTGNALLYLPKDSSTMSVEYGDCIAVRNKFKLPNSPVNPEQFDLKKYLTLKNIYYTISPQQGEWRLTGINQGNFFFKKTYELRNNCLAIIDKSIEPQREKSVLSALILGNRDHLDYDVIQSYTSAGVIHILAVSGLHVGLIYLLLNSIFNFFDRMNKWKIIRVPLMILIIWGVAVITGSSGSVVRAAMMITLIIIGKNLRWRIHTVNIVAASAFIILLLYGPLIIFDVGFQLSVCAILGISLLTKPISALLEINNKFLLYVWQITVVSFAATLGTVPLTLFYFHQFPLYFALANIIAIPLSTITIYGGLIMLILSSVPYISWGISKAVTTLLLALDSYISHIEMLPHSVIKISYFPLVCLLLIALAIVTLYLFIQSKRRVNLYLTIVSVTLIVSIISVHSAIIRKQKSITVFSFPGKTVLQLSANGHSILFADEEVMINDWNSRYFQQLWQKRKITESKLLSTKILEEDSTQVFNNNICLQKHFIQINDKRIAVLSSLPQYIPKEKLKVDYLVLANNPEINISDLLNYFSFKQLILATSNYRKKTERWMNEAKELNVLCHAVTPQGAFEITW